MKTRGITEGAMFCALGVIITLVSYYIPIFVILVFFIPVPMIVLGKRQGLKVSVISALAATLLIGLFLGPVNAIPFGALMLFVGCSLGYAYNQNFSSFRKVIIGTVGFAIFLIAVVIGFEVISGINFTNYLFQTLEESTNEVMAFYETTNIISGDQLTTTKEAMETNIKLMKLALPSAFIMMPVLFGMVNVVVSDLILKRLGYEVNGFKPLREWEMPASLKYFLMIFLFGDFIISIFQITAIPQIYLVTIMYFVNVIFFVMGLSLIFNYLDYKKVTNKGIKVLILFLSFLIISIVTIAGVADTYIGIRRIFRRESQIK
ncbi:YybS family protein [Acetobacterium woodii]|uniref:DUF2232 domain-containing protein n=1 Tax=Acetobacterium woodii (strain ATCC 29683 / DSM 1030 / JCM 2381 / KCTC 1655 / WB1) TaxID=931626 RepID=H6LCF8_ACEWD|nr:DUF2232 domain-containing protein [Acetobacterium woodii]AFA50273.1 hypothetical protein Awo_c35490 [Acetobacterium woodii DSM 1030]